MDMTGERRIPAPRQLVWSALNDPDVLRATIPGCESLEKQSDTAMKATASVKIGPISARFTGNVQLSDMDPPNGYTISGEGQGGVAGFAKGGAKVKLDDDGGATAAALRGARAGRRQARPTRGSAGRRHREAVGRPVLRPVQRPGGRRAQPKPAAPTAAQPLCLGAEARWRRPSSATADIGRPGISRRPQPTEQAHGSPVTTQLFPAAPSSEVAEPVLPPPYPQSSISIFALIPREPFGLPLAAWIGGVIYLFIVLLFIGSIF